jgi:hypothetical protein
MKYLMYGSLLMMESSGKELAINAYKKSIRN